MLANGDCNTNQMITSWQGTCASIKESIRTLRYPTTKNK